MRFVPVKSAESQATLMLHKTRDLLIKQKTMSVNALRGHLAEFGIIGAQGNRPRQEAGPEPLCPLWRRPEASYHFRPAR